jgi:amino acid transporter
VISLVVALLTAYSYSVRSGRMPSAGSAYKWTSHLISPQPGIFIGLCASLLPSGKAVKVVVEP